MKSEKAKIIVALDVETLSQAEALLDRLAGLPVAGKVGLQLFTREGPAAVRAIRERGLPVFLDLKLHDIPNTVQRSVRSIAALDVWLTTLHALGGSEMMEAAAEAAVGASLTLLAVTILTSHDQESLLRIGLGLPVGEEVERLASLAQRSRIPGMVCSPHEVSRLRETLGEEPVIVTPGVRPAWAAAGDQRRILTPRDALAAGASHLVIGRPITAAEDPRAAAERILEEIGQSGSAFG